MNAATARRDALLELDKLSVHFLARRWPKRASHSIRAVDQVSLSIARGETVALVGESGCGKTTLARAVVRLIRSTAGRVLYRPTTESAPRNLAALSASEMRPLRRQLQIVFQDPYQSLNPRMSAGDALAEVITVHRIATGRAAIERRVDELFEQVGISPSRRASFPHEFSGGERQRICIARAIAVEPKFIVCDEPISSLDLQMQAQILQLLRELQEQRGLAYLVIAHDLVVVRSFAARIAVMYQGRIVEIGTSQEVFEQAAHPYTRALLSSIPGRASGWRSERADLPAEPSTTFVPISESRFLPRCSSSEPHCVDVEPEMMQLSETHYVACHLTDRDMA